MTKPLRPREVNLILGDGGIVMTTEKKPSEEPDTADVTIHVDALTISNASTSANSVIQELVRQFSKDYGEKADEVDKIKGAGN
jgi:hypothetical protein